MFLTMNINFQSWFLYKSDLLIFAKEKWRKLLELNTFEKTRKYSILLIRQGFKLGTVWNQTCTSIIEITTTKLSIFLTL